MSIRALTDQNNTEKQNLYVNEITAVQYKNASIALADLTFIDFDNQWQIQLTNQNEYYQITPQTTLTSNNSEFSQTYFISNSNGLVTYLGSQQYFTLDFTISLSVNQSTDIYRCSLFKNNQITALQSSFDFVSNNVNITVSIHDAILLNQNDTVDLRIVNLSNPNRILRVYNFHILLCGTKILP